MVNFWAKVKSNTFHVLLLHLVFGQLFNLASGHSEYQFNGSWNFKETLSFIIIGMIMFLSIRKSIGTYSLN